MAGGRPPLFLERRSYRQRRLIDAVRLLAVLAAGLWMIPLIWADGSDPQAAAVPMSRALFYIFGVWFAVILAAFVLSGRMRRMPDPGGEGAEGAEEPGR
ncbi:MULTISPECIES: hypothetical protein [Roseobacter]|uniref:Uncharacterized protein n=1 Tax=Roseobacter ponti TaxID=1891787 RepID=A0A858SVH9_9RHOB|nr:MULTISPECIES: hypothetical protein [Roseobacter]QJF51663.1 hypothetical protein G3256_11070 [Roseobacter ponti]